MIEMALILPILLLFVFAIVDVGKAFRYKADLTHLSAQAARLAAVNSCRGCAAGQTINAYTLSLADTGELRANSVLTISFAQVGAAPAPANHCEGHPVTVKIRWVNYPLLPLITIPELGATATMRLEKDWLGNPVTGMHSGSDVYDVVPGSASADACP